ncbi:MAG: hypothetical protein N3B21_05940 [Clostridia bacterium]|nr:hypothetical protein [Clostridia bacterium]
MMIIVHRTIGTGVADIDESDNGRTNWMKSLKEKLSSIDHKLKEASENAKVAKSKEEKDKIKNSVKEFGLFALPYVQDEIDKGDYSLVEYLPEVVDSYTKVGKDELEKKDNQFWKVWFDKNQGDIKVLRGIIKEQTKE